MNSVRAFLFFIALRVLSVFVVRTWYVPDEYWQSLEVGHRLAFGYGHLTWEWTHGIRSYLHPVLIAGVYKALAFFQLDNVELLVLVPRVLQALLSATADYRFYRWSNNSKWSLFLISAAWFWFYTGSRTLSNTVEASLTTIALSVYPWRTERTGFLWLVALLAAVRPTAVIPWLPLCVHHVLRSKFGVVELLLKRYLGIGLLVGAASVALDSYVHGSLLVTPFEFVRANLWHGIGSFYGTHEWHWYLTAGLPTVLGITTVPFLFACSDTIRHRATFPERSALLTSVAFTLLAYSTLTHKEFRFVLALLPMCLYVTADYLARWSRKASRLSVWLVAIVLLAGNAVPAAYLGWYHQAGTTAVMPQLARIAREYRSEDGQPAAAKILFLMPCHSTPYFSHVHENVTMRFLTCEPNWKGASDYVDVAERFYRAPAAWLRSHLPVHPPSALPTHVVLYDVLVDEVTAFLAANYRQALRLEHAQLIVGDERIGKHVLVYERVSGGAGAAEKRPAVAEKVAAAGGDVVDDAAA